MKIAMMQPYFFPYLGYWQMMSKADIWIISDTLQYIHKGWINRNRIASSSKGISLLTIPVKKHPFNRKINEVEIADAAWKTVFFKRLEVYRKLPHYASTIALIEQAVDTPELNISSVNCKLIKTIAKKMELGVEIKVTSDDKGYVEDKGGPEKATIYEAKYFGGTQVITAPGGRHLYCKENFAKAGLELYFLQPELPFYKRGMHDFVPGLSIIDVFMFCGLDHSREIMTNGKLV